MPLLNRLRAVVAFVIKRAATQPWLVVATTAGLVVAIGLMMSIPIYADATYRRVFLRTMAGSGFPAGTGGENEIPPFTYLFRYDGSIYGTKEWQEVQAVDAYLRDEGARALGLATAVCGPLRNDRAPGVVLRLDNHLRHDGFPAGVG